MRYFLDRLPIILLILLITWVAFEIEKHAFTAISPHWAGIEEFFGDNEGIRRNRGDALPVFAAIAFAIGIPVLLSAISGFTLFLIDRREKGHVGPVFLRRLAPMPFLLILTGGILVIAGRAQNIELQTWGGVLMLFGAITVFTIAWACKFGYQFK